MKNEDHLKEIKEAGDKITGSARKLHEEIDELTDRVEHLETDSVPLAAAEEARIVIRVEQKVQDERLDDLEE